MAIPQTTLENRIKRSITIDPTVGSRSNLFHVFPEAAATASGRGHYTDSAREPGQKVHNIGPTVGSHSNFFHNFPEAIFDGVAWNRCDTLTATGPAIPPTALENQVKRSITIDLTVGSRSNGFHEFPKAIFEGVAWNRYETLTVSDRGHSTDSVREPGQQVHNY